MVYVHNLARDPYPVGTELTNRDPEPCGGTIVRDAGGWMWQRANDYEHSVNWFKMDRGPATDPETWTYVAGESVIVVESPDDWEVDIARDLIDAHGD